jgi:hypothetical protein
VLIVARRHACVKMKELGCKCSKAMSPLTNCLIAIRFCHPRRMVTLTVSQKESQSIKVIENAAGGRLSVSQSAALLQTE